MKRTKKSQNKPLLGLIVAVALAGQSLPVKAQTVLESIQETGILKIAIREDAAPFGYLDSADRLQGYCLDFFLLLEERLKQQLSRNTLAVRLLKSSVRNRFQLVQQELIDLECGPNTIRELSLSKVTFSNAFFLAQTQFLVSNERVDRIDLNGNMANATLGVIRNTSTEKLLRERYPDARLVLFSGVTARSRGVQALQQGKIDAMVSDGILLKAEADRQNLPVEDYILISEDSIFGYGDRYGMIIRGNDPQWRDFVNAAIASKEFQQLFKQWFDPQEYLPTSLEENS